MTNLWLSSSLFAVYLKVRGCHSFNVTFENVNVALSPFAVELYAESVTNVKVTPSTVVLNFVFFSIITDVGLFVGVREIETLKEFVCEVRKTLKPNDLASLTATSTGITRAISRLGRQGIGLLLYKLTGSINGLILGRSAYDNARDVFEQRAAKK